MARATVFQVSQLVPETTPGTNPGGTFKRLQAISIEPQVQVETTPFRPLGQKLPTIAPPTREWTAGRITGQLSYSDITYLLNSLIAKVTPTADGTNGKKWTFTVSQTAPDTIQTYTVQQGSSSRAHEANYVIVPALTVRVTRTAAPEVTGSLLGWRLQDGVTLASSSAVVPKPVLPTQFKVYADDTSSGIGTTQLTKVFEVSLVVENRYGPVWVLDSSQNSWKEYVELAPTVRATILCEADAQGMGLLTTLRGNSKKYIRFEALGDTIAGATPSQYKLSIDVCGQVTEVSEFRDQDGVYAIEWTITSVYDSSWGTGKAFEINVVNELAAL